MISTIKEYQLHSDGILSLLNDGLNISTSAPRIGIFYSVSTVFGVTVSPRFELTLLNHSKTGD